MTRKEKDPVSPTQFLETISTSRLRECVVGAWEGGERKGRRKPSISSSPGQCLLYENCSFKDTRTRWLCILSAVSYFGTERTRADMLRTLVGLGPSPARGQAVCVHNLQQKAPEWRCVRSCCGHSAPISLGVSGTQRVPVSTRARRAQPLRQGPLKVSF